MWQNSNKFFTRDDTNRKHNIAKILWRVESNML